MTVAKNIDMAHSVGELKGLLVGIQMMMADNANNLNRRIDDMHSSNTKRLDELTTAVDKRLDEHHEDLAEVRRDIDANSVGVAQLKVEVEQLKGKATRSGGASGAGAAAIVTAGVEVIKAVFFGP